MRFILIDRIRELYPDESITAVKSLARSEEFLDDHFPGLPVMPGVLTLEAIVQTSAWLIRHSEDFAHSVIVLKKAGNVRYRRIVAPGQTLTITADIFRHGQQETTLRVRGSINGQSAVTGRMVLRRYNLADIDPRLREKDEQAVERQREQFALLRGPEAVVGRTEDLPTVRRIAA